MRLIRIRRWSKRRAPANSQQPAGKLYSIRQVRPIPLDPKWLNTLDWEKDSEVGPTNADEVRDVVDSLPVKYRDLINGLFYEGLTLAQYAVRARLTRSESRRLQAEAMAHLKQELETNGIN